MEFKIGRKYEINLFTECVPVFKSVYDGLKLVSILSYEEAKLQADVISQYTAISSRKKFNMGVESMTFLKFLTSTDTYIVIAREYIQSFRELTTLDLTITIPSINDTDVTIIKQNLDKLGYLDAVFTKVNAVK